MKPYDWHELAEAIVFDEDPIALHAISVDPGAVHCGVAWWRFGDEPNDLWNCRWAIEMAPEDCVDFIRDLVRRVSNLRVFVEGFWLKPGLAALQQAGSSMETVEVIGTIRHLCRWSGVDFNKVANGQDAIATRLKAAGYQFRSRGYGDHAKDAECVGVRGLELKVRQIRMEK